MIYDLDSSEELTDEAFNQLYWMIEVNGHLKITKDILTDFFNSFISKWDSWTWIYSFKHN